VYIQWKRAEHLFRGHDQDHAAVASIPSVSGEGAAGAEKGSAFDEQIARFPEGIVSIHTSDHLHRLLVDGDLGIDDDVDDEADDEKRSMPLPSSQTTSSSSAMVQPSTAVEEKGAAKGREEEEEEKKAEKETPPTAGAGGLLLSYHTWLPPSPTPSKKGFCFRTSSSTTTTKKKQKRCSPSRSASAQHRFHHHPHTPTQRTPSSGKEGSSSPVSTHAAVTDSPGPPPSSSLPEPWILHATPPDPHAPRPTAPVQHTLTAVATYTHLTVYFTAHRHGKGLLTLPVQTYSACLGSRWVGVWGW